MASRGRGARQKGFNFERFLANDLTARLGVEFKRGLGQARNGGAEVADVVADDLPYLHLEAKRHKVCSIKGAVAQAVGDVEGTNKIPIAITKDDRKEILVTMRYEDWVMFLDSYIQRDNNATLSDTADQL